jgi:hypothetical protein
MNRLGHHDLNASKNDLPGPQHAGRSGAVGKASLTQGLGVIPSQAPGASRTQDVAGSGVGAAGAESAAVARAGGDEAARSALLFGDERWEEIEPDEYMDAPAHEDAEGADAGGEEAEPENTEATARLDGGSAEDGAGDGAEPAGDGAEIEGRKGGDEAEDSDRDGAAAAGGGAAAASMPSDALELAPDPSRAPSGEKDGEDDEASEGAHDAALRAADQDDGADDDEDDAEDAAHEDGATHAGLAADVADGGGVRGASTAAGAEGDGGARAGSMAGAAPRAAASRAAASRAAAPRAAAPRATAPRAAARAAAPRAAAPRRASSSARARSAQPAPQHRGKFERTVRTASGHDAQQDRYNRGAVRSNRVNSAIQIGRPGLRVGNRDEFHLQGDYAYRYMITSGSKAEVADKIWERDLQRGSSTNGNRLALNPSAIRKLVVNGVELECIMSWSGGQSAAWIAIKDLRGASVGAIRAAAKRAEQLRPKPTSAQARQGAVEMRFRPVTDRIATPDSTDEKRYVVPGQKSVGGNRVGDYLGKAVLRRERPGTRGRAAGESKRLEQANGGTPVDLTGKRELYNVTMNLPKDRTPPVAIDVAHPGDRFFVPKGKTFRREISLYQRTKTASRVRQTWVFGFIGRDEGTRKVADEKRRGWVPLRVLA